jgi:tape measure domain-containing protein
VATPLFYSVKFNSGLDKAKGTGKSAGQSIGSAFTNAFSIAAGIGMAQLVQKAFDGVRQVFVGFNADMEQAKIGFTTMLGSADAAAVMILRLGKFAAETPFEFPQVQAAAKKLMAFGWAARDIIPTLTAIGNAASGLGIGAEGINRITMAIGQIKAKGKVSAEELLQLAEAGVPAYDILAKKLHLTGSEVADIGNKGIAADIAISALLEGMNERFPDMMKAQSESFSGLISTLKDNTVLMISALSQDAFGGLKSILVDLKNFSDTVFVPIKEGGLQALFKIDTGPIDDSIRNVKELGDAMDTVGGSIRALKETTIVPESWHLGIKTVANVFGNLWETIVSVAGGIVDEFGSISVSWQTVISTTLPLVERLGSAFIEILGGAIRLVISIFGTFVNAIEWVIENVTWMVNGVIEGATLLAKDVGDAFEWLTNALGDVGDAFAAAANWIGELWSTMTDWIVENTAGMVKGILEALGPIGKLVGIVGETLNNAWGALTGPRSNGFSKWLSQLKKPTFNKSKGEDDFNKHRGSVPLDMGNKGGSKGAEKYANALQKLSEIMASLNEKIMSETGTEYQKAIAKIDAEVLKLKNDLDDLDKAGVGTSDARKKVEELKNITTMEAGNKQTLALRQLQAETATINAEITGDYEKAAEAQYQLELTKIAEKKIALMKSAGDAKSVAEWEVEAVKEAERKKLQSVIEGEARKHEQRLNFLQYQRNMLGMTNAAFTAAYQAELRSFIDSNTAKLQNETLIAEERMRLEQKLTSAKQQMNQLAGQNIGTAWGEAMRRMSTDSYDYAGRIVSMFDEMGSSISDGLMDIFKGTGDGLRGIFSSICDSILKMWLDMVTQMYIMNPLQSLFGNILGGLGGGGRKPTGAGAGGFFTNAQQSILSSFIPFAAGGYHSGGWALVGEDGPELANFSNPARIYKASDTKAMIGGGGQNNQFLFSPVINVASASKEDTNNMMAQVKQQWGVFRAEIINDLKNNAGVRSAAKGAVK